MCWHKTGIKTGLRGNNLKSNDRFGIKTALKRRMLSLGLFVIIIRLNGDCRLFVVLPALNLKVSLANLAESFDEG